MGWGRWRMRSMGEPYSWLKRRSTEKLRQEGILLFGHRTQVVRKDRREVRMLGHPLVKRFDQPGHGPGAADRFVRSLLRPAFAAV